MEGLIARYLTDFPLFVLFLIIIITFYTLAKGADLLVDEAVALSLRLGISKTVIGATIVSLGTTTPEAAVSVAAAISGEPGLALGNAVGSIICDTGLILGLATLISPLPLDRTVVNRQGWIQLGAGLLLVIACLPFSSIKTTFSEGGNLSQFFGLVFVVLLFIYLWCSLLWAKRECHNSNTANAELQVVEERALIIFLKLLFGLVLIIISAKILIPTVRETAVRIGVPEAIIAATLVAFGTSLPELVTAVTAAKKGHGELAVGNIIGADILNILFVSGLAAAVTPGGLAASVDFFKTLFPAMLFVLIIFRLGIFVSKDRLKKPFGLMLIGIYLALTFFSYLV